MDRSPGSPVVAVVGRPNVGKSSLVNRILGRRAAIVQETPGVTRDRRTFEAEWDGKRFELIDTGGIEPAGTGLDQMVTEQAQIAMEAADLILFVVDGVTGPVQTDLDVAHQLRRSKAPVIAVVNKVDRPRDPTAAAEFYSLGLGEPLTISALHGHGSGDLLDRVASLLPAVETPASEAWASLAIVGRPNVGKSSIANSLLGEERSIVDAGPGTTRDPIETMLSLPDGRSLELVDTAGMRKQVRITDPIEYFSWLRSRGTLGKVDAALLVVDASDGVTGSDQRLARHVFETGRACVVALNKWDLVRSEGADRDRFERSLTTALRFLPWATVRRTSAKTRRGVDRLLGDVDQAIQAHRTRIPTSALNATIADAQAQTPHPRSRGRAIRVLYAVQPRVSPPTILLFCNGRLEESYLRYLEHRLRDAYPLPGTPLKLQTRVKSRP